MLLVLAALLLVSAVVWGQTVQKRLNSKRILFIGNSYTGMNTLPKLLAKLAKSTGDTLLVESSNPGGHSWKMHSANSETLKLLSRPNWDIVVLQEWSEMLALPMGRIESESMPYLETLVSILSTTSPQAQKVFYRTWGRENGDAENGKYWPELLTYESMDTLLHQRYTALAQQYHAWLSPVGEVWKQIRNQHPDIQLYEEDGSHPSFAGSYLSACTFYALLLQKDPTLIRYNGELTEDVAAKIKAAAKSVVFDQLNKWKG